MSDSLKRVAPSKVAEALDDTAGFLSSIEDVIEDIKQSIEP